ncbi:hypothetical protein VIM7927_04390 [Vibrio mangrovi]|uniref:Uncharacterized protein n=1 Tax=Vibrio mangrovi TaxID=474394 RepID=A0A1Y6IZE5_9VIBR|nr:hypothetical protein VIM7927_04390 [Vibrio mangrovi]
MDNKTSAGLVALVTITGVIGSFYQFTSIPDIDFYLFLNFLPRYILYTSLILAFCIIWRGKKELPAFRKGADKTFSVNPLLAVCGIIILCLSCWNLYHTIKNLNDFSYNNNYLSTYEAAARLLPHAALILSIGIWLSFSSIYKKSIFTTQICLNTVSIDKKSTLNSAICLLLAVIYLITSVAFCLQLLTQNGTLHRSEQNVWPLLWSIWNVISSGTFTLFFYYTVRWFNSLVIQVNSHQLLSRD